MSFKLSTTVCVTKATKTRRVRISSALVFILLLVVSQLPEGMRAFGSDLDPGFGNGGIVTTDFLRAGDNLARGVAVQKDQKIVVAGENTGTFAVVRYNPDGSLDASFGQAGRVVTAFGTNPCSANALVLQSDGKIIVAGFARNNQQGADFAIVRYNTNGGLDSSFGNGGRVITSFGDSPSSAGALALQTDGKIIAAGGVTNSGTLNDFALARYNPDGSLDSSFDGDGRVVTDFNGQAEGAVGVAVQPDGRIVAAGTTIFMTLNFAVARYNANGSLDASFGIGGRVVTADRYAATGVVLQPDGKIVVAGWSDVNFFELVLARYNADGSLDGTFGAGGIVITDPGGDFETASAIVLQSDGKIVVGGGNQFFFLLARYNVDGSLDDTFASNGIAFDRFFDFFGSMGAAVAIQGDGRIVEAGLTRTQVLANDFGVLRYDVNGHLDASFDGDGKVTTDFPGGNDVCNAEVIQPDGKIIAVGGNAGDFALARYNPNGSLDTSFGNQGRVLTDFSGGFDLAQAVALQPDGKIIVAGSTGDPNSSNSDFGLARYNSDGSLDLTFSGDGKVKTELGSATDQARAVAVQADGKIVAAGGTNSQAFALVRYNLDGSLDLSFDGDGKVTTIPGMNGGEAFAIAIQPGDQKIVAAGGADFDFGLVRYNPNGSLDLSFDGDGMVVTNFEVLDRARAITLQSDGKIVVAGFTQSDNLISSATGDFALARYNTNGSLDTTFDGDGKVITNISNTGNDDQAFGVAIQSDGKIVAAGYARQGTGSFPPSDFALARYNGDGSLDNSFGSGGKLTTKVGNFSSSSDQATGVTIQPGDGKIVVVGQATNNGSGIDFVLARYGGTDTTPPTIVCPASLQAVTSRPRDACATVNYPPPVVSDNLPGVTFTCAPPSGSCFPVGTSTVSCTATDAAGNTASCGFTITVFDVVLQSDSDHSVQLLINSFTGDYSFCCPQLPPGQSPLRGRGQMVVKGSTFTLTHNAPTYRLQATIDAAAGKGSASFKPLSGLVLCPIQDRNIYDNLPLSCGNP